MINLTGYSIKEEIHSGDKTSVYRADKSGKPVILKLLKNEYPDPKELSAFKHEFDILEKINFTGVVQVIGTEKYKNSLAIVFEDIEGDSLANLLDEIKKFSLIDKLNIFIKSITALGEIHKINLVHKDIKPQNIILNKKTGELKLIDFGSASFLTKQNSAVALNSSLEGTLAYISPEQTGRMNRTVDYRTDFYSFGISFYQLLTGELPFLSTDAMELIHSHIAKTAISPKKKNNIPKAISDLVMKLMMKNPEDRYQSITGILSDLEKCKKYLIDENLDFLNSNDFVLGEKDFSGKFQIPEKLYGREKEVSIILDSFKKVANGSLELLLISGRSGIGKSVLINEINKPITEYNGYFISGKYDSFKRSIPYRAITQAFQSLIGQILSEPQELVLLWKEKILNSVGVNGKIIIEFIPELESLIGEQPPVAELDPSEAQNRFNLVFLNFIKTVCTKENPIAIFLDDLQWADNASIQLLETILSDSELKHLFIMLSFRDNEVLPTDSFANLIDKLKKQNFYFDEINLNPISIQDVNQLVSDTLNTNLENSKPLAEVIQTKTKGNPFFVNEVFKDLYDKNLIFHENEKWSWDISKIKEVKISENVIDLMVAKVKELRETSLKILKLAACIGDWFKNDIFILIANIKKEELDKELILLSNEGFLLVNENITKFVHDKIREATYTLITEEEKSINHFKIGSTYLKVAKEEEIEDLVFTIVNQLNQGIIHVTTESEKVKLFELNLLAAKKSLASTAYDASVGFYNKASELLPANSWEIDYKKSYEVYTGKSRAEFLSKDFETAEKTFDFVLANSKTLLEKLNIFELRFGMYVSQNRILEVIKLGKSILKTQGMHLPDNPSDISPLPEIIKAKIKIGKKPISSLEELNICYDEEIIAIMRMLNLLLAPSFIAQPKLFPVIVLKMVNLSLKKGNSSLSAFAYSTFGIIQGSALGDFKTGLELSSLGLSLLKKFNSQNIYCRTNFLRANMINHWIYHAKEGQSYFNTAIEKGLETGDFEYTSYSINHKIFQLFFYRISLSVVIDNFEKYSHLMLNIKQSEPINLFRLLEQLMINLTGKADKILFINGDKFNHDLILKEWVDTKNSTTLYGYNLSNEILQFLLGDKNKALEFSKLADPHEGGVFGMMFIPEHVFFNSLISYSLYFETEDKKQKKEYLKQIEKNSKRMKKWAENCEDNYGHKYSIIEGIQFSIDGKMNEAINSFKTAIKLAKKHEYILEEAIANELCAELWLKKSDEEYAELHLRDAHYAYKVWGCVPKMKLMEEKHPWLGKKIPKETLSNDFTSTTQATTKITAGDMGNMLDLSTVLKASQTIAGEINLGKLLDRMLKILFENAGAERGIFVLQNDGKWLVQAEGNSNSDVSEVMMSKPLEECNSILSVSIVNYVTRTKSLVLLNDATKAGMFVNDSYVKTNKPKSVLCYPIINKQKLVGVVYLENNLTTNAFTPDRLEILKVLSSQIAVSVENSLLYTNLEEKVEIRTKDLNQALVEVRALKEQQDGDYFLTTLLIEPLAQNNAVCKNLNIEFFIRQKKRFVFRKREHELGGDINITENVELKEKSYVAFLNADAMGKSIQGAGGVLVLGTVFKSIIQRTISTGYGKSVYPERWIKNAFIEMHKVFESFDGSMLMSLNFGLIDENTGIMYFISAEHPDVILYRDGKADFIQTNAHYKKLGTQGQKGRISVNVFSLQKDDIVIMGSDGRDDLVLGKDESNHDIINSDEFLILRNIEKGEGKLDKTYEAITASGKLMDDLSLLRIHWTKESNKLEFKEKAELFYNYQKNEHFVNMADHGLRLVDEFPDSSEILLLTSKALYQIKEYDQAIDLGERLYIRDPLNHDNILNLTESYKAIGNMEKVNSILKETGIKLIEKD